MAALAAAGALRSLGDVGSRLSSVGPRRDDLSWFRGFLLGSLEASLASPRPFYMVGLVWEKGENRAAVSQMLGTLGPLGFPGCAKAHFELFRALSIRRPLRP